MLEKVGDKVVHVSCKLTNQWASDSRTSGVSLTYTVNTHHYYLHMHVRCEFNSRMPFMYFPTGKSKQNMTSCEMREYSQTENVAVMLLGQIYFMFHFDFTFASREYK